LPFRGPIIFTSFLRGFNIHLPLWTTMDFLTAYRGFNAGDATSEAYQAWANAPQIGGLHLVLDLPALMIVFFITYLVYRGIHESRTASNMMVLLKLCVIFMVIVIGAFYINPDNWHPFLPNGMSGVMKGVSAVFFAYIGFDAISTTAEECENPQRDLPLGMMYSLIICTVLYVALSLVLTGLVSYTELNVGDPLAFVFERLGMPWISGIVAFSAIIAMASVLLVFQMGQPRIWMSMSRDGLLPRKFAHNSPQISYPRVCYHCNRLFGSHTRLVYEPNRSNRFNKYWNPICICVGKCWYLNFR
jgi:APA family basic amino acid/polyamine antiporter